ncbi:MAG: class I SAM-dependent methyltransferase [Lachnospiraceae bacterium]|nr:class I SAM-dependent methyltransferase [Lachnospiraceae bacterium]
MKLSKRLLAVAGMVTPGSVLADIGTDHAYIPIYLVENRIIPHAVAMDVNRGPLARAGEHIREHGLEDAIETRLSDGLAGLHAGEAQSLVIAGMGGALTVRILREGAQVLLADTLEAFSDLHRADAMPAPELILQPQSEVPLVRAHLEQNGFRIVREDMVFEDGKYYPMMKAVPACGPEIPSSCANTMELNFGPELLKMRHPVLRQFLLHERATQERILQSLERSRGNKANNKTAPGRRAAADEMTASKNRTESCCERISEVLSYIRLIDEALMLYSG